MKNNLIFRILATALEEYVSYFEQVDSLGDYDELKTANFEVLCGPQPIVAPYFLAGIKGLPSDSKYTTGSVLYILKNSKNAIDALKKSIYLGGDVDSIASITTGIWAGKSGIESIPDFMIKNVEGKVYLAEIAYQFDIYLKQLHD